VPGIAKQLPAAVAWLRWYLKVSRPGKQKRLANTVKKDGAMRGYSWRTLCRAKAQLNKEGFRVKSFRPDATRRWFWYTDHPRRS
jgi:hypothetical protein